MWLSLYPKLENATLDLDLRVVVPRRERKIVANSQFWIKSFSHIPGEFSKKERDQVASLPVELSRSKVSATPSKKLINALLR